MELREYWLIVRRWLWLVVLGTVVAGLVAFVVAYNTQPVYQSTVTVRVDPSTSRSTNEYAGLLVAEQLAGTYSQQMTMRPVMEEVIAGLDLQDRVSPESLAARVSVTPVRETQLIRVSVQDTSRDMAAAIANEIARVFILQNQQFEQGRYATSKQSLSNELIKVQQDLEDTQAAIDVLGTPVTAEQQAELARLNLARSTQQASYSNLLSSFEELRIAEASESSNVVVVEEATPSRSPIRPRTMSNTMLAAAVGGMLAIGVAFLIEYLDDTIKNPDDAEAVTGLSTLGTIAQIEDRGKHGANLITLDEPRSPISEGFRALRTNIQFAAVDGPLTSLLVTSAGPGEGKSTTAANLAIVMAQAGRQVILIDADLRRPTQHKIFDLPNGQGVTTALLDVRSAPIQHVQTTGVRGLRVMTSGPIPPNPAELLSSRRQTDLFKGLLEEVDLVIIDSPPVLTVTDALVLAPQADGVLLVVQAGTARREIVQKARDALLHTDARVLGIALNRLTPRSSGYYYYQYYQYYYGGHDRKARGKRQRRSSTSARRG